MSAFSDFWGLYTKGREFGFRSTDYSGGWHRGQDIPGANRDMPWLGKTIPLLRNGQLFHRGYKAKLGYVWVYKVGDEFDTYCHTMSVSASSFRLASWGEPAGSSWGGPHLHLVRSRTWDAAWETARPVLDPRPIIRARLAEVAKPAGGNSKPIEIPEEDELSDAQYTELKKLIQAIPSQTWGVSVGDPKNGDDLAGPAGKVLARTGGRAGKAASRSGSALEAIQNQEPSKITRAQIDALATELKTTLPPAIINALGNQLLGK